MEKTVILAEQNILDQERKGGVEITGCDVVFLENEPYKKKGCFLHSGGDAMQMQVFQEILIPEMLEGRRSNLGTVLFAAEFAVMTAQDAALG